MPSRPTGPASGRPEAKLRPRSASLATERRQRGSRPAPGRPAVLASLIALCLLAACSTAPADSSILILNDPYWDRANVEVVITRRADCDSRAEGYISTQQLVMRKNKTERITVPNGATVCWRHDRNPNEPVAGAWSGWTKASLPPGASSETDL